MSFETDIHVLRIGLWDKLKMYQKRRFWEFVLIFIVFSAIMILIFYPKGMIEMIQVINMVEPYNEEYCDKCNKKERCKGWIHKLYRLVIRETNKKIVKNFEDKASQNMQLIANEKCANDIELMILVCNFYYNINYRFFVDSIFYGLCEKWMFNTNRKYRYTKLLCEKYNLKSGEMQENTIYRKRLRFFDRVSKIHGIKKSELLITSKDEFELTEFIMKYRENRKVRKKEDYDVSVEHDRGFKRNLLSLMYAYDFPNTHQYRLPDFTDDLINFDNIYNDIAENGKNYFDKCMKYKKIELLSHYEAAYKFVKFLQEKYPSMPIDEKEQLLDWEANLRNMENEADHRLIEFPLMCEIEEFIELFFAEYTESKEKYGEVRRPDDCAKLLGQLTCIYKETIDSVLSYMVSECMRDTIVDFHISECTFAESIFKRYLGEGQHIARNKQLDKNTVADIIKIYKYYDYKKNKNLKKGNAD